MSTFRERVSEQVRIDVRKHIDAMVDVDVISPEAGATTMLASYGLAANVRPESAEALPENKAWMLAMVGLMAMFRDELRKDDPIEAAAMAADGRQSELPDLRPDGVQHRYPKAPEKGSRKSPGYVLADRMSDADVAFNAARMRKASASLSEHADRLEEWHQQRRRS